MRHKRGGSKLGRLTAHRWALFRNLLTALFTHERITTTAGQGQGGRPLADHMVTLAKQDNLHARRQALALVPDVVVVRRLFDTIGARYGDRRGGYTRILQMGTRRGRRRPGGDPGAGRPAGSRPRRSPTEGQEVRRAEGQRGEEGAEGGGLGSGRG